MSQSKFADTGFRPEFVQGSTSEIGPLILAVFAFVVFAQGLIYIIRPDMTGRSLTTPASKLRRIGIAIVAVSGVLLYFALSWWATSLGSTPPVDRRHN